LSSLQLIIILMSSFRGVNTVILPDALKINTRTSEFEMRCKRCYKYSLVTSIYKPKLIHNEYYLMYLIKNVIALKKNTITFFWHYFDNETCHGKMVSSFITFNEL